MTDIITLPGFDKNFLDRLRALTKNTKPEVVNRAIDKLGEIFNSRDLQEVRVKLPAGSSPGEIGRELAKQLNSCYAEILAQMAEMIVNQQVEIYHLKEGH